jgi:hypothetical protein
MTRAGHGILVALATAAGVSVVSTAVSSRSASSAVDAGREPTEARRDPVDAGVQTSAPADARPALPDAVPVRGQVSALREPPPQAVAAPVAAPSTVEGDELKAQLEEVRKELVALEEENARARGQRETWQRMSDQLDGIRGEITQRAERREAEAAEARQLIAQRQQAVDVLVAVEQRLAVGDAQVVEMLDRAALALPFPAQRAVQSARSAIQSEDLARARSWIRLAIAETESA